MAQSTANLVQKLINLTNGMFLVAMVTGICIFSYRGPSMRQVIAIAFRKCNINPMSGQYIQLLQIHFWYTNHVADISLWLNSSGPVRDNIDNVQKRLFISCEILSIPQYHISTEFEAFE